MLADERLANLFHDRYGMLRRTDDARGETPEALSADAEAVSEHLGWRAPFAVYRGQVLLRFLKTLALETDPIAKEFAAAFEGLLHLMLQIYTGGDPARMHFEDEVARELGRAVCQESIFDDAGCFAGESKFLTQCREHWRLRKGDFDNSLETPTLDYQRLSTGFRDLLQSALTPMVDNAYGASAACFSDRNCPNVTSVVWRSEWLLERQLCSDRASQAAANSQTDSSPLRRAESWKDVVRRINFLGMDDYLFQDAASRSTLRFAVPR